MQEDPGAGGVAGAGGPEKAPAGMFAAAFTAPQLRTREHRPGEPEPRKWRGAGTAPGFPVEEPHAATRARTAARSRGSGASSAPGPSWRLFLWFLAPRRSSGDWKPQQAGPRFAGGCAPGPWHSDVC